MKILRLEPKVAIFIEDSFDSAHHLPHVPVGHKCKRPHGHTYRVRLEVEGKIGRETGWIIDYSELKSAWAAVKEQLDHHDLNDVISNPTCELIAKYIWDRMNGPVLAMGGVLARIDLRETERCGVVLTC